MGTRQNTVIFGVKAAITNTSANNDTSPNTTSGYTYRKKHRLLTHKVCVIAPFRQEDAQVCASEYSSGMLKRMIKERLSVNMKSVAVSCRIDRNARTGTPKINAFRVHVQQKTSKGNKTRCSLPRLPRFSRRIYPSSLNPNTFTSFYLHPWCAFHTPSHILIVSVLMSTDRDCIYTAIISFSGDDL